MAEGMGPMSPIHIEAQEACARFVELVERSEQGEVFYIERGGRTVARLEGIEPKVPLRGSLPREGSVVS